ncbi:MAG TPA: hypothetical protein VHT92_10520 [Candidatus Cybelea sp.]|nr:hypothetical protein [Candidatus Cybelea sp.]
MGPVGSRHTSEPPSGPAPPGAPRYRWRALAIVVVILLVMCAMIAWSQWYAIHVNVPRYQAQHGHTATH